MRTEKDTETMDLYNKYNASEWLTRKEAIRRKRLVTIISASAAALLILILLLMSSCEKKTFVIWMRIRTSATPN